MQHLFDASIKFLLWHLKKCSVDTELGQLNGFMTFMLHQKLRVNLSWQWNATKIDL